MIEPQLIPVHLQYNQFARDEIAFKNPNPEERQRFQDDTMAPEVLTKGLFRKSLEAPSHVVLNHANSWTVKNPTLAPLSSTQAGSSVDSVKTSDESRLDCDRSMTSVSLTLRVGAHSSKFATVTYYKPNDPSKE